MNTKLFCRARLPSRLQRPAVCRIESSPASSRQTWGKSTSTPASIKEVETTRQGIPCAKRSRISASKRFRSDGHSRVVRQYLPSSFNSAYSFCAVDRRFTTHNTWFCVFKRATSFCASNFPARESLVRRKISKDVELSFQISRIASPQASLSNSGCSAGCVAVQRTAVAP